MIYLDNAATTAARPQVVEAMMPYFSRFYGNPSSMHTAGRETRRAIEKARKQVAAVIHCEPRQVYFTAGGSESDNWALRCFTLLETGKKHIITSAIEHHAILHTCEYLEKHGCRVTYLPVDNQGFVDPQSVQNAICEDTGLISIMAANNEIGTIQPIMQIGAIAKAHNILFHTDAVQAVGAIPVDVQTWNCDMLSLSGHKFHGPKGIGVLYIRKNVRISNLIYGGAQERGLRAGTENVPAIVGLGQAITLANTEMCESTRKMTTMRDRLISGLQASVDGIHLSGSRTERLPGNVHFVVEDVEGEALLTQLDLAGIQASGGSACTSGSIEPSHVLLAIGTSYELAHNGLRLSLSNETTEEEIETVLRILPDIISSLRQTAY